MDYRPAHAPSPKLKWLWASQLFPPVACVYALLLFGLWLIDGSSLSDPLQIGYWFSWQVPMFAIIVTPYVAAYRGTFDGLEDGSGLLIAEQSASWINFRMFVQLLLVLGAAAEDIVFFVLRVIDMVSNCDTGSACDLGTSEYAASAGISIVMALVALLIAFMIAKCPMLSSAALIPAPPPAMPSRRELNM